MDLAKHAEGLDIRPNNVMAKTARLKLRLQIAQLKVWQDGMVSLAYAWWANVWMWIYALHAPGKKTKKKTDMVIPHPPLDPLLQHLAYS